MKYVAIIGTAGRDKDRTYTLDLYGKMCENARSKFKDGERYHLVSGGAAWADHLAVELYLARPEQFELTLYLPAPLCLMTKKFVGDNGSAGSASNYYHDLFENQTGITGRLQILEAQSSGATVEWEDPKPGMGGFFARNKKVANFAEACLAYTWGEGKEPADGGTRNTWDQIKGRRVHVSLASL